MITDVKNKTAKTSKMSDRISYFYKKTAKVTEMNMLDEYALDEQGRFQIQRFDQQPAFSSFLPIILRQPMGVIPKPLRT